MTTDKLWLSANDAAEEIGVHVETMRRLLRIGAIRAIKLGSQWRIHRTDWEKWLGSLTNEPSQREGGWS